MDITFIKNNEEVSGTESNIFYLNPKNNKSSISTDVENLWRLFGVKAVEPIIEDLLVIGVAVFTIDKKFSRKNSSDNWTRKIKVNIPVIEFDKINQEKVNFEKCISFLTGDEWTFNFYKTSEVFRGDKLNNKYNIKNKADYDCVSLFSGGLDSYCGALSLLEESANPFFVSFKEYHSIKSRQEELLNEIIESYCDSKVGHVQFGVSPKKPHELLDALITGESTSRSRSFLFIVGALVIASIIGEGTKIHIPENGFIGINVPLTPSRLGSCSTRTTHPYFIKALNGIFMNLGINHKVVNIYSAKTKGEIVNIHKENHVFKNSYYKTLSCSHPCQSRYDKISPPINCGYCYPCLIRKASVVTNGLNDIGYNPIYKLDKAFLLNNPKLDGKASDLKALLYSIKRFKMNENNVRYIRSLLKIQGPLNKEEVDQYERVYRESMNELISLIACIDQSNSDDMKIMQYIGELEYSV